MSNLVEAIRSHQADAPSTGTTLLQLVCQLNDVTADADETVDEVLDALDRGAVHLTGNFRGCRLEV